MAEPLDVPPVSVRRGGITHPPASVEVRGLRVAADVPFPDVIESHGWCAPAEYLGAGALAQVEAESRPCGGKHRWERWVARPQCGCPQCAYTERSVECAGCSAVVREVESGFEELWEGAPWP